jgi:multidrug efflux pump subunit AcrB
MIYWPGAGAEKIEQLVTRRVEETIAENQQIEKITSNTRTGVGTVIIELHKEVEDPGKQFDDIKLRLDSLTDLPRGTAIHFMKDFGDTATLLLTVASPRVSDVEVELRAQVVREGLEKSRSGRDGSGRAALVGGFPKSVPTRVIRPAFEMFARFAQDEGALSDARYFEGARSIRTSGRCR